MKPGRDSVNSAKTQIIGKKQIPSWSRNPMSCSGVHLETPSLDYVLVSAGAVLATTLACKNMIKQAQTSKGRLGSSVIQQITEQDGRVYRGLGHIKRSFPLFNSRAVQ